MADLANMVGGRLVGAGDGGVTDVTHDSRRVGAGHLYVALRGANADGHDFVAEAAKNGASGVCVDHQIDLDLPQIVVEDTRSVLGDLAAAVHHNPSHSIDVVGVTGTNGKTTVTHYITSIAEHAGLTTGLVGTIHTRIAGKTVPATMTTPESSEFQRLLANMRDAGVSTVAAEVSSHALEFGRVKPTRFAVAAFTNLSQDHLDFHGDMASYRAAKERLFTDYEVGTAVFNVDDRVGSALSDSYSGEMVTVGRGGDVEASDIELGPTRSGFHLSTPWGAARVSAPVIGEFNVSNVSVAVACCLSLGVDFPAVVAGLAEVEGVPGRFQIVSGTDPIAVIVDYAHTPEGVAGAVETARRLTEGRVIGLIGAGGDRDTRKRPAMGSAISAADVAIVTSDNPRSEDPGTIVDQVAAGLTGGAKRILEVDRRTAISRAIAEANDGDIVLILGRGHEPVQRIGSKTIPFDDREVAARALADRRKSANSAPRSGSMSP